MYLLTRKTTFGSHPDLVPDLGIFVGMFTIVG